MIRMCGIVAEKQWSDTTPWGPVNYIVESSFYILMRVMAMKTLVK